MKDKLVKWIKKQVLDAGARGCVFGLSGGLDSSVVGILCQEAFPDSCLGLLMPCFSLEEDVKDAQDLAEKFSISTRLVDLKTVCDQFHILLQGKPYDGKAMNLAIANLKPRLRMITLYYHANKHNYLVVGTGNRSEAAMGYCTKHGDTGVDILPLGGLVKSQVRKLAKELGIPDLIINKAPSAGLWPGQTDESEMGISYADLDKIILAMDKKKLSGLDKKLVTKVKQKMSQSEHKRKTPPVFLP
jgi:NAD+ synthase